VITCLISGVLCALPDGAAMDVQSVVIPQATFTAAPSGALVVGQSWDLVFYGTALAPSFPLLLSLAPTAPLSIAEGMLYMDPVSIQLRFIPQGQSGSFETSSPSRTTRRSRVGPSWRRSWTPARS
jgi:hypothetical protein